MLQYKLVLLLINEQTGRRFIFEPFIHDNNGKEINFVDNVYSIISPLCYLSIKELRNAKRNLNSGGHSAESEMKEMVLPVSLGHKMFGITLLFVCGNQDVRKPNSLYVGSIHLFRSNLPNNKNK